jgi:hypothetical protein
MKVSVPADRMALQIARLSALRATSELVDQLQAQLAAERKQYSYKLAEKDRELAELRYELAQRDTEQAFAQLPTPSRSVH